MTRQDTAQEASRDGRFRVGRNVGWEIGCGGGWEIGGDTGWKFTLYAGWGAILVFATGRAVRSSSVSEDFADIATFTLSDDLDVVSCINDVSNVLLHVKRLQKLTYRANA